MEKKTTKKPTTKKATTKKKAKLEELAPESQPQELTLTPEA